MKPILTTLVARFPNQSIQANAQGDIIFPARHPDVGALTIVDDGDEFTIYVGDITHGHFDSTEKVIEFLEGLFADRVLMWKVWTGGGWRIEPRPVTTAPRSMWRRWYVWSRPL